MANLQDLAAHWRVAPKDLDPVETKEWLDGFDALLEREGPERATFILRKLLDHARTRRVRMPPVLNTPYKNTIALEHQPQFPGNLEIEQRLSAIIRWNALAMVVRANKLSGELGGHIASYASAADLFEVGFNHFFRAGQDGDLVYFQPHSSTGVYARAYLEGRLTEEQLDHYRRETAGRGLSSYPHPWLMPGFWQFPTGSMGLGPLQAIYQARFMRYLENRAILKTGSRKVWAFVGDGEMDEPESLAGLSIAAREGLDNLIFVVNCNLQRLDGPVRGNGSIVQELEGLFAGNGWNVIKLMWGGDWDPLFARDHDGILLQRLHETVDGEFQTYAATDGRFNREHFFNKYPDLRDLVAHMSDEDIDRLRRGGHDPVKIHAAYHAAVRHPGQPTVILAQTKKGYGMGSWGQGKMGTHQQKKLNDAALLEIRDRFALPLGDDDVVNVRFHRPPEDAQEMRYLHAQRKKLGGYVPARSSAAPKLPVPPLETFAKMLAGTSAREQSTTMVFVQLLAQLLKDSALGKHVVPIVADEARTFGMQTLFRQVGIYSSVGQLYEPEDHDELLYYKEATDGQILEEGITEAGSMASWIAAATSYSRARRADAAVLHLLLDLRLPAHRRPCLGRGRLALARFPRRRHRRPHDALRRGTAAPGRHLAPDRIDDSELRRLRSVLRLRARGDPAGRHAAHGAGSGRRFLLRHRNERELRAPADAARRGGGHPQGDVSLPARYRKGPSRQPAWLGHHPARSLRRSGNAGKRAWRRRRCLERDEFWRAAPRSGLGEALPGRRGARGGRHGLCSRRPGDDPRMGPGPLPHAGNRRLRPLGHARRAACLLRRRPRCHRARGAWRHTLIRG